MGYCSLIGKGFLTCPDSFPSSRGKKPPAPKLILLQTSLDALRAVSEVKPTQIFYLLFLDFCP